MKTNLLFLVILILILNFPPILSDDSTLIHRTVWNNPSPGYLFLSPMDHVELSIYDNSGYKVFTKRFSLFSTGFCDFKLHPNGKLSAYYFDIMKFIVLDSNLNIIDTVGAVGYPTDNHEFLILPNGNYLVIADADTFIDMRRFVPNGHPNCRVNNFIIQEIDYRTKRVVWQWSALDHFSITDATEDIDLQSNYIRPFHINSIELLSDGNLLISCRHLDEITKINRQTGQIIWRMGGSKCRNNQFTFVNDTINNFFGFSHQHDPRQLPNGNILLFDNGNLRPNRFSRVVEYSIDEVNRRVTKVWEYRAPNNIVSSAMGSCQRLPNGNTLIAWGGTTAEGGHNYLLSEVTPDGTITLEFYSNHGTYRGYRFIFKMDAVTHTINSTGLYNFTNSQYNTNASILVSNLNGTSKYTIEKHNYQPHNLSQGGPCSVLPYRWVVTKQGSNSIAGYIYFNLNGLNGFSDPQSLKVYYRSGEGFGAFTELNTYYNSQYNRLESPFAGVGEYCIGTHAIGVPRPIFPANNEKNVPISPRFVWNKFISGEKYHIQLSFSQNFQNIILDVANISDTTYTLSNLYPGKTYYWRIRAERENCVSEWSNVYAFTTVYEKLTVFSPADSSINMPLKVQFSWASSSNAWAYQLQLALDSKFERIVVDTVVNNSIAYVDNLSYFTDYFWRVRLLRGEEFGMWSDVRRFKTLLAPPVLMFPENNSKSVPISGELHWFATPGAIHYYLQISKSNYFTNNVVEIVDLKEPKYQYSGLEYSTVYYWRVRATGENGKSEWSEPFKFTTQLPAPELLRPPFADTLAPISGTLKWKEVTTATHYEVEISERQDFEIGVLNYKVTGQTFCLYSGLAHSTIYYWRVRALNNELESPWSKISWFKTIPENYLPPPILVFPEDQTLNIRQKDKLLWNSVDKAEAYELQISTDRYFNNLIINKQVNDTSYSILGLPYGTRFFWRVRAINSSFNSFWSNIYSFTTGLREPTLFSPSNLTNLDNFPVEFEWEKTASKAFYELQIAYDQNFEFILTKQILYDQSNYTLLQAPRETWFFWRVKANVGVLESEWSEVRQFRIRGVNSVSDGENQIYFYEKTPGLIIIQSDEIILDLSIYNILGQRVFNELNPKIPLILDLSQFEPSCYFISIKAEKDIFLYKLLNIR